MTPHLSPTTNPNKDMTMPPPSNHSHPSTPHEPPSPLPPTFSNSIISLMLRAVPRDEDRIRCNGQFSFSFSWRLVVWRDTLRVQSTGFLKMEKDSSQRGKFGRCSLFFSACDLRMGWFQVRESSLSGEG